jgi:hypothetical protein
MSKKKMAKNLQSHPKVQKYTEQFAQEVAQMLISQFEKSKEQDEKVFVPSEEFNHVMEQKGKDLGNFVKSLMEETKKENEKMVAKQNLLKVTIR